MKQEIFLKQLIFCVFLSTIALTAPPSLENHRCKTYFLEAFSKNSQKATENFEGTHLDIANKLLAALNRGSLY